MKALAKRILGPKNLGRIDYFFKPELKGSWGGPFNGQSFRQRIFQDLIQAMKFQAIVETGTFRGTTTAFLAATGLPVYTVESDPRSFAYSTMRFIRHRQRVHLYQGGSEEFLTALAADASFPRTGVFFYLDAHWENHLPLAGELTTIFNHWRDAVVMVDDFQVPGTAYTYDDYGPGKVLSLGYLEPLGSLQMTPYFPAAGPENETGAKRGCVVLGREPRIEALAKIPSLRRIS